MRGVEISNEEGAYQNLHADAYVLALGSFSRDIVRIPRDREHCFHGMVNTDSTAT